jgi:hypothetical protein
MRERLRQLGGTLHIQSNEQGTRVTVILPFARSTTVPAAEVVSVLAPSLLTNPQIDPRTAAAPAAPASAREG